MVNVGVKVSVGRGVSDGGMVGVSVEVEVGKTVAVREAVGEGSGEAVQVGAMVGVGEISLKPPHAIRKRVSPDMKTKGLLVTTSYLALPKTLGLPWHCP
jgi:hypothetical protein